MVTKIMLKAPKRQLKIKDTEKIIVTVSPGNASDKRVEWTTSDKKIATVDAYGLVRGIKAGTVTITATAKDGSGTKASCTILVTK